MERCLRKNGEAIRKKPRSTSCPRERSERLELIVMFFLGSSIIPLTLSNQVAFHI